MIRLKSVNKPTRCSTASPKVKGVPVMEMAAVGSLEVAVVDSQTASLWADVELPFSAEQMEESWLKAGATVAVMVVMPSRCLC